MSVVPLTLEQVKQHPVFPDVLDDCESALMLFCAGFYGANDCVRVARAGISDVTAIDRDDLRLQVMRNIYPFEWEFRCADVWEFDPGREFDLVVVDCPIGDFGKALDLIPRWCSFAKRAVVVGSAIHGPNIADAFTNGWKLTDVIQRNRGVCWMLLEPSGSA